MKTRHTLATAARAADDYAKAHGLRAWVANDGTDLEGLHYVADQRALRAAALLIDGVAPAQLEHGRYQLIHLSPKAASLMPVLMAVFIDGYAVGRTVKDETP